MDEDLEKKSKLTLYYLPTPPKTNKHNCFFYHLQIQKKHSALSGRLYLSKIAVDKNPVLDAVEQLNKKEIVSAFWLGHQLCLNTEKQSWISNGLNVFSLFSKKVKLLKIFFGKWYNCQNMIVDSWIWFKNKLSKVTCSVFTLKRTQDTKT